MKARPPTLRSPHRAADRATTARPSNPGLTRTSSDPASPWSVPSQTAGSGRTEHGSGGQPPDRGVVREKKVRTAVSTTARTSPLTPTRLASHPMFGMIEFGRRQRAAGWVPADVAYRRRVRTRAPAPGCAGPAGAPTARPRRSQQRVGCLEHPPAPGGLTPESAICACEGDGRPRGAPPRRPRSRRARPYRPRATAWPGRTATDRGRWRPRGCPPGRGSG